MCMGYYIPEDVDQEEFYVSPLYTPRELLSKLPRIEFCICERDPLRDDALRLALRAIKCGVKTRIRFFKYMPHGLLNMAMKQGLPEASVFLEKVTNCLRKLLEKEQVD